VSYLRRISTRSLIVLLVAVLALAAGGAAIAVAAGGGGPTPPPKPLDEAIHDALGSNGPAGVTARIRFTNKLFPSGALLGQAGSALMSGASGRLWATNDGRGRIELQSDSGDVQIVWNQNVISAYDASSNTVYRADLPAGDNHGATHGATRPTLGGIDTFLAELGKHWLVSAAHPTHVAGNAAYSVSVAPKHDGGLLGSLELAWDALRGTPLKAAIFAQGSSSPVLGLTVTSISYGSVSAGDVDVAPPAGAKVVDLGSSEHGNEKAGGSGPAVTGIDAVEAAAGFQVIAPDSLVGLPRKDVRLVGSSGSKTVLAVYGEGLGAILVVERKADGGSHGSADITSSLPKVSLDGLTGRELATQLGTVIQWQRGGTEYLLAGSVPPAAAETAARDLK